MRARKEQMTNDELLVYFIYENGIDIHEQDADIWLWEAIEEELYVAEMVEAFEYCQRLVEFKEWLTSSID